MKNQKLKQKISNNINSASNFENLNLLFHKGPVGTIEVSLKRT